MYWVRKSVLPTSWPFSYIECPFWRIFWPNNYLILGNRLTNFSILVLLIIAWVGNTANIKCIFEKIFVTPKKQYFEKSENEMSIHNFLCARSVQSPLKKWRGPCISISWFLHFQLTSFLFNFLLFGNILLIFQILSNACYFPKLFYVRCRYHLRKTYFFAI